MPEAIDYNTTTQAVPTINDMASNHDWYIHRLASLDELPNCDSVCRVASLDELPSCGSVCSLDELPSCGSVGSSIGIFSMLTRTDVFLTQNLCLLATIVAENWTVV